MHCKGRYEWGTKLFRAGITEEELKGTGERVFSQAQLIMDSPFAMANWLGVKELLIAPKIPDTPPKNKRQQLTLLLFFLQILSNSFTLIK